MSWHRFSSLVRAIILHILPYILVMNVNSQWTLQYYDTNYSLRDMNFINENTGFGVGGKYSNNTFYGIVLKTSNAGNQWNAVLLDSNAELVSCYFLNNNTGFAVGGRSHMESKMFKTTNCGDNWFDVPTDSIAGFINSIIFFGQIVFATTMNGVFKSTNGGYNWFRVLNNFSNYACSYFLNENTGWSFYDYGFTYKTTNAGLNWAPVLLNYRYNHKAQFINANTGYFICDSTENFYSTSKILKTTNGGSNWFQLNPGLQNHHLSLHFVNENTGYVSGAGGEVIKTTNAGESWNISWTGVTWISLEDINFIDAYTGYACGGSGVIIKTTCGGFIGILPVSSEIPKEFSLFQNYPNPFNPSTNIKFAISKSSNVKLTVFDMLGREVETLVNENVSPGIYEVKWDAARFSSGVYFYKLLANDFIMVKRMSLIK